MKTQKNHKQKLFGKKFGILGINIIYSDYDYALKKILLNFKIKKVLLISPIASQTLVKAFFNQKLKDILLKYDGLYPDSQWIRKSFEFIYNKRLEKRVYGPDLMIKICKLAKEKRLKIFLYGTTAKTLEKLKSKLDESFPGLKIVGKEPSIFRILSRNEKIQLIEKIQKAETDILFISLGSPLEQIFAYDLLYESPKLTNGLTIIPVGAAFDFISGNKLQAPKWMQNSGLEWFFRFIMEPKRMWFRYLILGPVYIILVLIQKLKMLFRDLLSNIFYRQYRLGLDRKIFTIYKFRTMVNDAEKLKPKLLSLNEADGPVFKLKNDPRYTKFGKKLAHMGLDELPQIINVIKGDMAIIGPRPLPINEANKIPIKYQKRFSVKPGITSLWVVRGAHNLSFRQWMESDIEYIEKKSFFLDLYILAKTILLFLNTILFYRGNNKVIKSKG